MKFTALLNLAGVDDAGLSDKTDFNDWVIMEYIMQWQVNGSAVMENNHVWLNYSHLIEQIPMLSVRTKSGVSARIKKLKSLGLISTFQDDDYRLFVKITDIYNNIVNFRGEPRVNAVHTDEHPVHTDEHPVHTDEHPVHTDEHTLNNQLLNNQDQTTTAREEEFEMSLDWQPTESDLKMSLFRAGGFEIEKIDKAWLVEFVMHWSSESSRKQNQAKWTAKFAMKCIGYFRNPNLFDSQQGIRRSQDNTEAINGGTPPKDNRALLGWMRANGFGDGPVGMDFDQLRGWLRRKIKEKSGEQ